MKNIKKVFHNRHGNLLFRVVSAAEKNGGKIMICEVFIPKGMKFLIVTDIPKNFY